MDFLSDNELAVPGSGNVVIKLLPARSVSAPPFDSITSAVVALYAR